MIFILSLRGQGLAFDRGNLVFWFVIPECFYRESSISTCCKNFWIPVYTGMTISVRFSQ